MNLLRPNLSWQLSKIRRRATQLIVSRIYQDRDRDIEQSIFVAGTARSGTTWLGDVIASQGSARLMFEPFQSEQVRAFRQFSYFHYMRPTEDNDDLLAYCQDVLSGNIRNSWIDRQVESLRPQFRVIKEIRANLFLKWLHDRFPELPILFMIRHPCAVVLSRMKLDWATDGDIHSFLMQPELVDDFLIEKLDIIQRATSAVEKHAIIWCISNMVPLRQFDRDELPLVFYEDLCLQPELEIPRIFEIIGRSYKGSILEFVGRPSTTSRPFSAVVTGDDRVSGWKNELATKQIDEVLAVVEAFDLGQLYDARHE